ncbi:MAG: hypothetical protein R3337_00095 [Gammaproteobacteria bacterium]|nr:hypothetical protein [Gammaproteobacteria bacterium]
MTAFNPNLWSRRIELVLDTTLASGGPHTDMVLAVSAANLLTNAPNAITLGHANAMQSDGADLRASTDSAGLNQLALWVSRCSLSATPASSEVWFFIRIPSVEQSVTQSIWLHLGYSGGTATPETEAGSYGRNAVFSKYARFRGFQLDILTGSNAIDWTGNTAALDLNEAPVAGFIDRAYETIVDEIYSVPTYAAGSGAFAWGLLYGPDGTDGQAITLMDSGFGAQLYLAVGNGNGQIDFNGGTSLTWTGVTTDGSAVNLVYTRSAGGVGTAYVNGVVEDAESDHTTSLSDITQVYFEVSDTISYWRVWDYAPSTAELATEHAMLVGHATFSEAEADESSTSIASLTWLNVPATTRLDAYFGSSEPHGAQADVIASASAGTNVLSITVTGFAWVFYSAIPANGDRPIQGYVQVPAAGATLDYNELRQVDLVFLASLADDVDEGTEYDLTHTTKLIGLNQAIPGRTLYSSAQAAFKASSVFTSTWFPFFAVDRDWIVLQYGWDFESAADRALWQSCGFSLTDDAPDATVQEEWVSQRSNVGQGNLTGTTCYYSLAGGAATALAASGPFNFPLQSYQDGGANNRGSTLQFFARQHGRFHAYSDLVLAEKSLLEPDAVGHVIDTSVVDANIVDTTATVDSSAPYTGMSITELTYNATGNSLKAWAAEAHLVNDVVQSATDGRWYICTSAGTSAGDDTDLAGGSDTGCAWSSYTGEREVTTGNWYPFGVIIDGNSGTPQQVHTYAQRRMLFGQTYELRVAQFGEFVDGTYTTTIGVYVDNLAGNAVFTDLLGVERTPPATVNLVITGQNPTAFVGSRVYLKTDPGGVELINQVAGSNPLSVPYEYTADQAVVGWVRNASGSPAYKQADMAGTITAAGFAATVFQVED